MIAKIKKSLKSWKCTVVKEFYPKGNQRQGDIKQRRKKNPRSTWELQQEIRNYKKSREKYG